MKALRLNSNNKFIYLILFVMLSFFLIAPELSHAAATGSTTGGSTSTDNAIVTTLCKAIDLITGGVGKAIAILIVISLAIMLFLGKVTWGLAIAVGVGMGILFGASDVVNLIAGDGTAICQNVKAGQSAATP